jgi:hypothetical protein
VGGLPSLHLFGSRFVAALPLVDEFFETAESISANRFIYQLFSAAKLGDHKSTFVKALETCRAY